MKFLVFSVALLCLVPFRRAAILGGESPLPLDDPEVVRLSEVALTKFNEMKGLQASQSRLIEVVSATVQVVSGSLTRLTLRIAEGDKAHECVVEIWEQPWLNKTEVNFSECKKLTSEDLTRPAKVTESKSGLLSSSADTKV